MRYKLLGKSGLRVSEICLGTMTFGEDWGWGASKSDSKKIFDSYRDKGGNFIDTANRYTEGTSEKFVGEFIATQREQIVLATKYTLFNKLDDPNMSGNHRKNMLQSVEGSLKRLNTDYIDILYLHAWDFLTPVEEVMRGLDDLVRAGKVLYIGISDTPAWIVSRANMLAELRGWTSFIALQIEYSLIERTPERELLPMAKETGMSVVAWAPIAGGALTGKYLNTMPETGRLSEKSERLNQRNSEIARAVVSIAEKIGKSPAQVAIRWTMQRRQQIIPIIGARKSDQIKDSLAAVDFELDKEYIQQLDEVSNIKLGFPHDFLNSKNIRKLVYAGTLDKIETGRI